MCHVCTSLYVARYLAAHGHIVLICVDVNLYIVVSASDCIAQQICVVHTRCVSQSLKYCYMYR